MQDLDRIYQDNFIKVYRYILSISGDPHLAEDITQETFFKALKHIDRFNGSCKISTWLCTIAKNTYYSHAKKQNKQTDLSILPDISDVSFEERFADKETAYAIHEVLHKLKEPYKEVFWLRTFGDLSFAQIGTLFSKTESWARVTYYRAKTLIKEELP